MTLRTPVQDDEFEPSGTDSDSARACHSVDLVGRAVSEPPADGRGRRSGRGRRGGEYSVSDLVVELGAEGPKLGFHRVERGDLMPVADLPLAAVVFVEQLIQDAAAAS